MSVRDIFETLEYGPAPESPDKAKQWLQDRDNTLLHFIGGDWQGPDSGAYFETINPASGELLAQVADGNEADVNHAVAAAADALEGWVAIGGHGRYVAIRGRDVARRIRGSHRDAARR